MAPLKLLLETMVEGLVFLLCHQI